MIADVVNAEEQQDWVRPKVCPDSSLHSVADASGRASRANKW